MKFGALCGTIKFMKIIHTADIHLDSPLVGVADPVLRRYELVKAFESIAEYARNSGAAAVIVAGDLFDEQSVSERTVRSVADVISRSSAEWFVLKGNHGGSDPYDLLARLCGKIKFFGEDWTYFDLAGVTVCGRELGNNDVEQWRNLRLDSSRYNIVVLHGDVDDASYGFVDKKALAESGAKYVALGHRHAFCKMCFGKVRACYSGSPEPRGFDECAQTGFVEIDTDADKIRFVPQSKRSVVSVKTDVTGVLNDVELERKILDAVADVNARNMLNFTFVGTLKEGLHLLLTAQQTLKDKFFALRIKDETRADVDLVALSQEVSLRGEFVKLASQITDEKLRDDVLKLGLAAIAGEDLP